MDWKENILNNDEELRELLKETKTVAVLGIHEVPERAAFAEMSVTRVLIWGNG